MPEVQEPHQDAHGARGQMTIHGTLDEQLARCNHEIERCESYLSNPDNPDRFGAEFGLLDWLVNRQEVLAELKANELRIKR
jgi:hypothetical protein